MNIQNLFDDIKQLKHNTARQYIYGYGSYGQNLFKILRDNGIEVDGFVVTNVLGHCLKSEHNVINIDDVINLNCGFILALNERNTSDVLNYLNSKKVEDKRIVLAGKHLETGNKRGMRFGSIEITTNIGCSINCRYCPQKTLLKSYFSGNKERESNMSVNTFERCLDFFPESHDISFGGMSEPFLNVNTIRMIELACKRGRKVSLYTTLVGLNEGDVDKLLSLPLEFVVIHCADKRGYAKIPQTKDYYKLFEKIINAKKSNGQRFVNMCNAQAEADDRLISLCQGKYEIFTTMTDRAGNIKEEGLIKKKIDNGQIRCGNMGEKMDSNIILPDGTVLLCCMDYGMKHVLGNIFKNSYEELMCGDEMIKVKKGLQGDSKVDLLCRKCSYAVLI